MLSIRNTGLAVVLSAYLGSVPGCFVPERGRVLADPGKAKVSYQGVEMGGDYLFLTTYDGKRMCRQGPLEDNCFRCSTEGVKFSLDSLSGLVEVYFTKREIQAYQNNRLVDRLGEDIYELRLERRGDFTGNGYQELLVSKRDPEDLREESLHLYEIREDQLREIFGMRTYGRMASCGGETEIINEVKFYLGKIIVDREERNYLLWDREDGEKLELGEVKEDRLIFRWNPKTFVFERVFKK